MPATSKAPAAGMARSYDNMKVAWIVQAIYLTFYSPEQ
jgi:hypothetical protein